MAQRWMLLPSWFVALLLGLLVCPLVPSGVATGVYRMEAAPDGSLEGQPAGDHARLTVLGMQSMLMPHPPIRIDGDADLVPENGVVSGNGTGEDPFVISGWSIRPDPGTEAILIRNTTRPLVVRECEIDAVNATALRLESVRLVQISKCGVRGGGLLISVNDSEAVAFRDLDLRTARGGAEARIERTVGASIEHSLFAGVSLYTESTTGLLVARNAFVGGGPRGIELGEGSGSLERNLFQDLRPGVGIRGGAHRFDGNIIKGGQEQLRVTGGAGHLVVNNSFSKASGTALVLGPAAGAVTVVGNNVVNRSSPGPGARDDSFGSSWSRDGRGNHWSEWTSPDADGDGVVDSPYSIPGGAGARDLFPAVAPFANWVLSPPGAPGDLVGTELIGDLPAAKIEWAPPPSDLLLIDYIVMRGRNATVLQAIATLSARGPTEFVDESVLPNATYYYSVIARDPVTTGPMADAVAISTRPRGGPEVQLRASDFTVTPESPAIGTAITVAGVGRNAGNWTATSSRVRFYEGSISVSGFRVERLNISIPPQGSVELSASWNYSGGALVFVEMDAVIPPDENPGNQQLSFRVRPAAAPLDLSPLLAVCIPAALVSGLLLYSWKRIRRFRHLPAKVSRPRPKGGLKGSPKGG